ncbi:MAG: 1-acyl-sn-glycerol-3-phosphate acyltransferase [Acidobacteriota bacterium]
MTPPAGLDAGESPRPPLPDPPTRLHLWHWPTEAGLAAAVGGALSAALDGVPVEPLAGLEHPLPEKPLAAEVETLVVLAERRTRHTLGEALQASDRGLVAALGDWVGDSDRGCDRRSLILISSARIHAPSHRHLGHVGEDELPRRPPEDRVARRWRRLEAQVTEIATATATAPVVLRPTPLAATGGRDVFGRLLAGKVAATPAGYDPPIQWLSCAELAAAIAAAVRGELAPGTWHVAPPGVVPLHRALRREGVHRLPIPTTVLRWLLRWRGDQPDAVEGLRYPFTVSDAARRRIMTSPSHRPQPLPPASLERPVAELEFDPFSLDRPYIDRLGRTLFRFLHDRWWRIEWRGLEHVPRHGPAVLVANHRGHQPWDGVMMLHRLARDLGRYPRFLIHPALVKLPHLAPYISRCGGIPACRRNGDWVLSQGKLLAVFPEGIRGAFLPYRQCHRLTRFRPDYARLALRHGAPIIPFVVVGSAEIFPILAKLDWDWWKRLSDWPTLPITPTLSLVPLPSKWHIEVLPPIDPRQYGAADAADDPAVYRALDARVRSTMAETLGALLARRPGIFHGSAFASTDHKETT